MSQSTIKDLPTEILSKIFLYVSEEEKEEKKSPKASIKSIRLVSRRFENIGSAFLIDRITARLATTSLSRLEEICQHHSFRKSITHVTIDLSYYDVKLAQDMYYFGENFGAQLFRFVEWAQHRASWGNDDQVAASLTERLEKLWSVPDEFNKLDCFNHDDSRATVHQKNLINLHKEYARLTAEQESVRLQNRHLWRLAAALKNLPFLDSICLSDRLSSTYRRTQGYVHNGGLPVDHPEFFISALVPSGWSGSLVTAFKTNPPIEMLGELLSRLGNSGIRPRSITVNLGVPVDLNVLRPTQNQCAGIRLLVSRSSEVDLLFSPWTRKHSLAENNDRSRNEMLSLGALITALTSTSKLQQLSISLSDYPCFYQFPTANLSDLIPFKSTPWPQLSSVNFDHVPCDMEDLVAFADAFQQTIKAFIGTGLYLRTGDWDRALDVLRGLRKLESIQLRYPRGGRYGDRYGNCPFPEEEVEAYVLGTLTKNPL